MGARRPVQDGVAGDTVRHGKRARPRGALALDLVARWRRAGAHGLIVLTDGEQEAEHLGADIHSLFPDCPVMVFPRWDCLPYDPAGPSREIMGRRSSVLRRLAAGQAAPLVIATPEAVLQRLPPRAVWQSASLHVRPGAPVADLESFFERTGYGLDMLVDEPGEAAVHGHVIDIFPAGALGPVRIEHDSGQVTRIDSYDPVDQRTIAELPDITLDAASEFIAEQGAGAPAASAWLSQHYPNLETLFDYLPDAPVVAGDKAEQRGSLWFEHIREAYDSSRVLPGTARTAAGALPSPEHLYLSEAEWRSLLRDRSEPLAAPEAEERVPFFAFAPDAARGYRDFVAALCERGQRVVLAAADERDLTLMARRAQRAAGTAARRVSDWHAVLDAGSGETLLLRADFEAGFVRPADNVAVIAAADLLGSRAGHRTPMALPHGAREAGSATALRIGDAVIHAEHGIGLLRGIETVTTAGMPDREGVRLEYAGGATLIVPIADIASIWRYGADAETVSLDRIDGENWRKRRDEVEREIARTAQGLLQLVREREARQAPKLDPPLGRYERFVAGFPYVATPDQAQAVEEILSDLKSGHPMDRLVCGDVGFGKTEVALRAAAACVLSGYQAAIVAPTTVLARQHLGTFRRRFAGFGTRIAPLSRLIKPAEARSTRQGLADGSTDIVIGTQAIAGKDIRFDRLGLVIIDEEQRFGARTKARLRGFAEGVHVLTLSATPIPRTLQAAMVGLHALSLLETPPARRLPTQTVLAPFAPDLVRQALLSERRRRGQSFVVCPRIEDIDPMAARLRDIVPQLELRVVHGRMPAAEIDETMVAFADGDGDVLLATNIIESGLDLPRANTILIWRPDRFGAAQLHQLRGRVGRGRRRGIACLLTDPDAAIAPATERRLRLLTEFGRLGAGFAISRRDLDLRGAGDLLGDEQAGHIRLIGVDLYHHLLAGALAEARGEATPRERPIELNLGAGGSIPADYVSDPEVRINLYARLARLRDIGRIEAFLLEIEDRFGPPPAATLRLFELARIREMARRAGAVRVDAGPRAIAVGFEPQEAARLRKLAGDITGFRWKDGRLVSDAPREDRETIGALAELFDRLERSQRPAGERATLAPVSQ